MARHTFVFDLILIDSAALKLALEHRTFILGGAQYLCQDMSRPTMSMSRHVLLNGDRKRIAKSMHLKAPGIVAGS